MLNKELCKECWKKYIQEILLVGISGNLPSVWNGFEQIKLDARNEVRCPVIYIKKEESLVRKRTDKPPSKCPFYLEHIV